MKPQAKSQITLLVIAAIVCFAATMEASCAWAQESRVLKEIEGEIASDQVRQRKLEQRSKIIDAEMASLRNQMISTADAVQAQEAHMTRIEEKLQFLQKDVTARREKLKLSHKQMQGTLAAIERLSRNPPEALFLAPGKPINVVRSATLLRAAVPRIHSRARNLQKEVKELDTLQTAMLAQFEKMATATQALENERQKMRILVSRKASLRRLTDVEKARIARRVAQLTAQAQSLRDLFNTLQKNGATDRRLPPKPKARKNKYPNAIRIFPASGGVRLPARGVIVKSYGQPSGRGNTAKGLTIAARAGAQVIAPFDGRVAFSGPFRGYGKIIIIEHRGGYHTLLAGLGRLDSSLGQWLLAGEPIGAMAGTSGKKAMLYLELRRRGRPVNPLPWVTYKTVRRRG
ncbi:MAG: peptidoglycan DD-metalloendopeptidase family protein [Pseudomonadota bacterium]|nr:peptidoglycan DD-metalloendopeptidase family protein [Pseudomonadota bacterium]